MLQQTRVEAVKPYFERFITALPNIEDLAKCPEDKLLKLWEGLGYYNRVRNMQSAAKQVMEHYQGELPSSYEALLGLSGIGEYTAGAIASIAFDIAVPAVDGNVLRVITRITENDGDIMKQSVKNEVRNFLKELVPRKQAGDFNQALIELGALICIPNGMPKCGDCPLAKQCQAQHSGGQMDFPVKRKAKTRKIEERTILVICDGEQVALRKRPAKGMLAGLYEFPNYPGHFSEEAVLAFVKEQDFTALQIKELPISKHIFSHVEWRMIGYMVRVAALENETELLFAEVERVEKDYPIPAAFQAYTDYLNIKLGQEKYASLKG